MTALERSGIKHRVDSATFLLLLKQHSHCCIQHERVRAAVGSHKGRIEFRLIEDPNDIKAGIALNEKTAGLAFPNTTGNLDFNSSFRSSNPVFRKWCQDLFISLEQDGEKGAYLE